MVKRVLLPVLAVLLLLVAVFALCNGRYPVPLSTVIHLLGHPSLLFNTPPEGMVEWVVIQLRWPRILAAIAAGSALAGAGAGYQALFRNPMVDPSLLGVTAGAAFGAALAILLSKSIVLIQLSAFAFGLVAVFMTVFLSKIVQRFGERPILLILCGIVTNTLFTALLSMTKYLADTESKLPAITYWLMGSLATVSVGESVFAVGVVAIGFIPLFLLRWRLNVMAAGEEEARTMGIEVGKVRFAVIVASTLMTASVVAISGMIGWVGLVVPHLVRMMVGPDFRILFPASILFGSLFLLTVDTAARILFPVEIPLGILTSLFGAPFFILLLFKGRRGWS